MFCIAGQMTVLFDYVVRPACSRGLVLDGSQLTIDQARSRARGRCRIIPYSRITRGEVIHTAGRALEWTVFDADVAEAKHDIY